MASPDFKTSLENQVQAILFDYIGQGGVYSDPVNFAITFDRRIGDFNPESDVPIVAIIARQATQKPRPSGEIGTSRELWDWIVDIYYLDVQAEFTAGYAKQGDITNRIRNALENEPRLRNLSVKINPTSPTGAYSEYVYNNDWTSIIWDNSGQDGDYYAFVSEMHLLVQTARN